MKIREDGSHSHRQISGRICGTPLLIMVLLCLAGDLTVTHGGVDLASPQHFFTNVASRLLQSELHLDLHRIQLFPTNQYSPTVHRLLQVTANLYDSATNRPDTDFPFLPTVFRPLLRRDPGGAVWIAGYREVVDASLAEPNLAPLMVELENEMSRTTIPLAGASFASDDCREPLAYGVPLIVGVKRGYPQFSRFALENEATCWRSLYFHREPGMPLSRTNQAHGLSVSNRFAVQLWNSYTNPFPRELRIVVVAEVGVSLSNRLGVVHSNGQPLSNRFSIAFATNLPAGTWKGFTHVATAPRSGITVVSTNGILTRANYVQPGAYFTNSPVVDAPNVFEIPTWLLNSDTKLRVALIDVSVVPNRLVDFVNLSATHPSADVVQAAGSDASCNGRGVFSGGDFWCTNRLPDVVGSPDNNCITMGIWKQIQISMGAPMVPAALWQAFNAQANDQRESVRIFLERLYGIPRSPNDPTCLDFSAPFSPRRTIYQVVRWEANDPLVHRTITDLTDGYDRSSSITFQASEGPVTDSLRGVVPRRYMPWGGNPLNPSETNPRTLFQPAIKDSGVRRSDHWDFPSGESLTFETLGRVHRGTPWQTIYLKSMDTDLLTWSRWSGITDSGEAEKSKPVADRRLVTLLDSLFNEDPRQRLSVNERSTYLWANALSGIEVITNSGASDIIEADSEQAPKIVDGIARTREMRSEKFFPSIGDLLAVPELSFASPWINTNGLYSSWTVPDVVLEKIPSQLLGRVRSDSYATLVRANKGFAVRFTGYSGFPYSIQQSSDLRHWMTVSTNIPSQGVFNYYLDGLTVEPQFYRSTLLP